MKKFYRIQEEETSFDWKKAWARDFKNIGMPPPRISENQNVNRLLLDAIDHIATKRQNDNKDSPSKKEKVKRLEKSPSNQSPFFAKTSSNIEEDLNELEKNKDKKTSSGPIKQILKRSNKTILNFSNKSKSFDSLQSFLKLTKEPLQNKFLTKNSISLSKNSEGSERASISKSISKQSTYLNLYKNKFKSLKGTPINLYNSSKSHIDKIIDIIESPSNDARREELLLYRRRSCESRSDGGTCKKMNKYCLTSKEALTLLFFRKIYNHPFFFASNR